MSTRLSRRSVATIVALMLLVLVVAGSSATAAVADGNKCTRVQGRITLEPPASACPTPVGCRATGTIRGGINGVFEVVATSVLPSVDVMTTGVVFTTADTIYTTPTGTLTSKDAQTLSTQTGEYGEIITITDGTGSFKGATGTLTAAGVVSLTAGTGIGSYTGQICLP